MDNRIVCGRYSIILGNGKFNQLLHTKNIKENNNILLKITYYNEKKNNERKNNHIIKTIKNYYKYYSLVDSIKHSINPNSHLYKFLKKFKFNHELLKSKEPLCYYFIPKDGDMDLYDNLYHLEYNYNIKNIWINNTLLKFKLFIKHISEAIYYIHEKNICHFDIKPENIVLDNGRFKYIDFGLAEDFPFTTYIKLGPRGTIEYIPFSTNNFRILNIFTEFLPYMPCDDWYRKEDGIWRHIHYDNNPSKNTSPISSSIYKADVYSLGRTINSLLKVICLYKDCTLIDKQFLNKMLEPKVFLRSSILDENVMVPPKILNIPDEELDINCCLLWRVNTNSLGRPSKLISFKFT